MVPPVVLWAPGDEASIFLIDRDGVRHFGSPPVLPQADTPDWEDPEQPPTVPDHLYTDRYKLTLLVGRVLARSPYLRPDEELPLISELPVSIALPVRKLWKRAAGPRDARPRAADWITALDSTAGTTPAASGNS